MIHSSAHVTTDLSFDKRISQDLYLDSVSVTQSALGNYTVYRIEDLKTRSARYLKAAELLRKWLDDPSDHDVENYPALEEHLKKNRFKI